MIIQIILYDVLHIVYWIILSLNGRLSQYMLKNIEQYHTSMKDVNAREMKAS